MNFQDAYDARDEVDARWLVGWLGIATTEVMLRRWRYDAAILCQCTHRSILVVIIIIIIIIIIGRVAGWRSRIHVKLQD
jgi:hypothetical protein